MLCFLNDILRCCREPHDYYKPLAETKRRPQKKENDVNALTEVENEPRFAAFVALDWGDKKHAWSLQASDAKKVERGELARISHPK